MIKTIAIDFDGVLARYDGFRGADHLGPPLPDAFGFLQALLGGDYEVVIFTTRADSSAGIARLWQWFIEHGFDTELTGRLKISCIKPPAWLYIDDRCFLFGGRYPSLAEIENFKPWWKKQNAAAR